MLFKEVLAAVSTGQYPKERVIMPTAAFSLFGIKQREIQRGLNLGR